MARFSQNTIIEIAGFDNDLLAEELLYGQDSYWNITITDGATPTPNPLDLTNWTFQFRLIRRQVTAVEDSRNGLVLVGLAPAPGATTMDLDINVLPYNPANGQIRLLINDDFFTQVPPVIDSVAPPVYTGYLSATLPAVGTVGTVNYIPAQTKKILLCFIVRSDGISSQPNP